MLKHLLFSLALISLSHQSILACSCITPSSFCESINFNGQVSADIILRGKVIGSPSNGKEIKVEKLLLGELNAGKITIPHGFCDLNFNDLKDNSEYIIALNKSPDNFHLVSCAISFLLIENEVIKGKIAPGIDRLDYDELFSLESCGDAFSQITLSKNLQLFPNPTSDAIQIHNVSSQYTYENLTVIIFDAAGKKIGTYIQESALLPTEEWFINIRDFAAGVYFVQISNSLQKKSYKLVKV